MKYDTLCVGDLHLVDRNFTNKYYDAWIQDMFLHTFDIISESIKKHKIKKLYFIGDTFDYVPKNRALTLFSEFMKRIPSTVEVTMFAGNHELISGVNVQGRQYYQDVMKEFFEDTWKNLRIVSYHSEGDNLFCSHQHISKLEKLTGNYNIIYSHFRSGLGKIAADEIDVVPMQYRSKLVVTGDIHYRLAYDKIVYSGSPIDTHFSAKVDELHTPSVLLLNETTCEWEWETTLNTEWRKRKVVYPSIKKLMEDITILIEEAKADNNFLKIVVHDKKHNIRKFDIKPYLDHAMFEFVRVDLEADKENREVTTKIAENLSKNNISDNLLSFILENNQHKEWEDVIKSTFATYEKGVK